MGRKGRQTPEAFVWSRIDVRGEEECWPWGGQINDQGYGLYNKARAHRYVYEMIYGSIPEGLQLDHTCHTETCTLVATCPHRRCCNPKHLEAVTQRVNLLRGNSPFAKHARKTHCPRGHPYAGDNLHVRRGQRECRTCHRDRERERKRLLREQFGAQPLDPSAPVIN